MKWSRFFIILTVVLLVGGIAMIGYALHSRMTGMEYQFQVDAILAASRVANEGEISTDPGRAVIAEYEGKRAVISPGNYLALSSYLRKDAAYRLFFRIDRARCLKIVFCDEAVLYACPEGNSVDAVLIRLETGNQAFNMHADGGNLWSSLVTCAMKGTYHDENLFLD